MSDIDGLNQDIVGFENEIARCPRCGTEVIVPHGRYAECQDCGRTWVTEATAAEGRAALEAAPEPEPCTYCHGEGSFEREFYGGASGFKTMTCPACGGTGNHADEIERRAKIARNESAFADAAPEPPSPATVNDGGPEYAVAEMWRGYAEAAEERADNAEWAVNELRAALEGLLEEPEIERRYCPRCGKSLDQHPVRHAAGCPVQRAEDALRDTADVGELARKLAAEREALVQAAEDRNTALEVALRSLIYGANWLYGDAERATRALEGSTNELAHVRGELIVALSDLKGRIVFAQQTLHSGEDALKNAASGDKLAAEREAQAAEGRNAEFERRLNLAESKIGALLEAAWVIVDPSGNAPDAKTALRAALAALEGESHE